MISSWDELRYLDALERLGSSTAAPHVDVALTGPASTAELEEALAALARGPLDADEAAWMRKFGHAVHG